MFKAVKLRQVDNHQINRNNQNPIGLTILIIKRVDGEISSTVRNKLLLESGQVISSKCINKVLPSKGKLISHSFSCRTFFVLWWAA